MGRASDLEANNLAIGLLVAGFLAGIAIGLAVAPILGVYPCN